MKKFLYLFLFLLVGNWMFAQRASQVMDSQTLTSEILQGERKYAIYLPPDYSVSERSYPVLYLLHPAEPRGTVPNQQGWINYGNLKHYLDKAYLAPRYPGVAEETLKEWYIPYNIYELVRQLPEERKGDVAWYISCGDDDALSVNNARLHGELKARGIAHEFRIADGRHDWKYWRSVLPDMLRFVSQHFVQ